MQWPSVLARRLARHHLLRPAPRTSLADVVGALCGIHAQVMPSAELSLGLRIRGFTHEDLDDALWRRRELVKTYGIRGTVHLFPARELGLWLAALRAWTPRQQDPKRLAYIGMTEVQYERVVAAIGEAVAGRRLTREELGEEVALRVDRSVVERTVGAFGGQWKVWQAGIGTAALRGLVCFGPPDGARVTFVSPSDWIGSINAPAADAAQREVFRRYLAAYGPATEREFAQWSATQPATVHELVEALGDAIERVDIEGTAAWQIAGDRAPARTAPSTLLLPRFDCYVVGSHPRDVLIPPPVVARASATGLLRPRSGTGRAFLAGPMPVLVVDGAVAGIWESKRAARRIAIRVQPFARLDASRRDALERAALRVGEVFGVEAELAIGAVTTRPHL
ncbi:MAG: hypothetical protein AUH85_13925 [Chloroflexi bacterium 13_1_40CM_4_68_4]|nr:MAG: hypothetical protein AUH85_13925 [Chloroflexi bacterium 13_1_40CM_4_68_4]